MSMSDFHSTRNGLTTPRRPGTADDELNKVGHDVRRPGQLGHCIHPVGDEVLLDVASDVIQYDVPPSLGVSGRDGGSGPKNPGLALGAALAVMLTFGQQRRLPAGVMFVNCRSGVMRTLATLFKNR